MLSQRPGAVLGTAKLWRDLLPLSSRVGLWLPMYLDFSYVISCYGSFLSRPVHSYVHKIVLQFYVFSAYLPLMWSILFSCFAPG
jgi:hypothetical protein